MNTCPDCGCAVGEHNAVDIVPGPRPVNCKTHGRCLPGAEFARLVAEDIDRRNAIMFAPPIIRA